MNISDVNKIVGSNIKACRLKQGLSGDQLASLMGCSQQHVSRIERGAVRLSIDNLCFIAFILNVNAHDLITDLGFKLSTEETLADYYHVWD
ncbi:helix-turn-helix domain-containing protein [Providencia sp. Me31A]|uniref:helix-turn-helix domain-containing protein n=1 Tax=Providencia sp. Me31A TaxID=3392637 RepID=UPI003D268E6B